MKQEPLVEKVKFLYARKEAAASLDISPRSIDYYIAAGEIRTTKVGGRVLIPMAELKRFASRNHYGPVPKKKRVSEAHLRVIAEVAA